MTMLPPPEYDFPPTIVVIEHVLTSDRVDTICQEQGAPGRDGRPPGPGVHFLGCAIRTGKTCEVWRIDDATIRRHEFGHCNGWPSNHPTFVVARVAAPIEEKPKANLNLAPIGFNITRSLPCSRDAVDRNVVLCKQGGHE